ncbi:MAG: hypothetical protein B6U77_00805, partial [Candidatus Hecatellales archaeon ex4484_218]
MSFSDITVSMVLKAVDQTKQGISQTRKNLQDLEKQVEKTNINLKKTFKESALTIANIASSALNLYNAYDRLAAVQARLMSL